MKVYYNDNNPFIVEWLRRLVAARLIADGEIDDRPIEEVSADDVRDFDQVHLFAGIAGWPYALDLARWGDRPVWTASCPCQPLSSAGKRQGADDPRHLWPALYGLIAECEPAVVFGEQVASPDGREWLAAVRADLEELGYAVGAADLCAASVGAPHLRQRLFWVADRVGSEWRARARVHGVEGADVLQPTNGAKMSTGARARGEASGDGRRRRAHRARRMEHRDGEGRPAGQRAAEAARSRDAVVTAGGARRLGDADESRPQGRRDRHDERTDERAVGAASAALRLGDGSVGRERSQQRIEEACRETEGEDRRSGFWYPQFYVPCADGRWRPIGWESESPTLPLATGVSTRVDQISGYGNSIVPQVAATFVESFMDVKEA